MIKVDHHDSVTPVANGLLNSLLERPGSLRAELQVGLSDPNQSQEGSFIHQ